MCKEEVLVGKLVLGYQEGVVEVDVFVGGRLLLGKGFQ